MSDDLKKQLEAYASIGDEMAKQHAPSCDYHKLGKDMAAMCRAAATSTGPAQVATSAYRSNYETIFGKRVEAGQA
jgi:hypothetical protein